MIIVLTLAFWLLATRSVYGFSVRTAKIHVFGNGRDLNRESLEEIDSVFAATSRSRHGRMRLKFIGRGDASCLSRQ